MKVNAIFLLFLLTGCVQQVDLEEIKKDFVENRDSFEQLSSMIKEENYDASCFAVGTDRIGDYRGHNGKWNTNQNYERRISIEQVLREVGISPERYQDYLTRFNKVDSERIEYCPGEPSWIRIMVHRSGLAVAGCLTTININGDLSVPKSDIKPGYSSEIIPLGDGWYLNHDCT